MDRSTDGRLTYLGEDITACDRDAMTRFRADNIGFVFQSYNLLPDLTALENNEFSTEMARLPRRDAERALEWVGKSVRNRAVRHFVPRRRRQGEALSALRPMCIPHSGVFVVLNDFPAFFRRSP